MEEKSKFGEITGSEFQIGDLVEWSRWDKENQSFEMNYGIITEVINEIKSNRLVSVSKVVPVTAPSVEMEFFTLSLRLISKAGDHK